MQQRLTKDKKAVWDTVRLSKNVIDLNDCSNQSYALYYYWRLLGYEPELLFFESKGFHAMTFLPGKGVFDPTHDYRYKYYRQARPINEDFGGHITTGYSTHYMLHQWHSQFTFGTTEDSTKAYYDNKLRKYLK